MKIPFYQKDNPQLPLYLIIGISKKNAGDNLDEYLDDLLGFNFDQRLFIMLNQSFSHIMGVSSKTEKNLWDNNIKNWNSFLNTNILPLTNKKLIL